MGCTSGWTRTCRVFAVAFVRAFMASTTYFGDLGNSSLSHLSSFKITKETGPSEASLSSTSSCLRVSFAVGLTEMIEPFATSAIACKGPASTGCSAFVDTY